MKTRQKSNHPKSKSEIITNLVRNKLKYVKVSKISVQDKINFDKAKKRLRKLNNESSGSELDESSCSMQESLKEVSISSILKAIDELSSEPDKETKTIVKCSSHMSLNSEIFWTSPTAILRAVKHSILRRNWEDVTHLLLLLLQHKDQYIPLIQCVCGFIARFNPLVKQLGLQEQFEVLNIKRREVDINQS